MRNVGVWLAGAYGNVATCVVAGCAAISRGLADDAGLVTETGTFAGVDLAPLDRLVFGGHEIREGSLVRAAQEFGDRNGLLTRELRTAVAQELRAADAEVRPGVLLNAGEGVTAMAVPEACRTDSPAELVARVQADLRSFQERNKLDTVIVVNLTSTEPILGLSPALQSRDAFQTAISGGDVTGVPSSVLYAYAAVDAGFPFVDFTPAIAAGTNPVREAAQLRGVPHMGRDGKTGETLVKTVLAPMFMARHLPVLSWEGFNMLGNRDGAVLREAGALASKVRDKDEALRRILEDDETHSRVRIDYVPSLEDWKQAYDFIHFRGFLGARMQLHFLWQGCDSALAAPLVVDLVRLTDLAQRRGEVGTLPQLACFFKTPIDVPERDFASQMGRLDAYARTVREEAGALRRTGA